MQVGDLLHKWNVENDQACNKLPISFQLVRLVGCGLNRYRHVCPSVCPSRCGKISTKNGHKILRFYQTGVQRPKFSTT